MRQLKSDDNTFTGLEAAIVLIAFVVIAAVFSYVVLRSEFLPNQNSQETTKSMEHAAGSAIRLAGNVYGLASVPSSGINEIRFSIGLAPGESSINLTKMTIVFSTPATYPTTLVLGTTVAEDTFTTRLNGRGDSLRSMDQGQPIEIDFKVAPVPANTSMTIEIRPSTGAALSFTRTVPPTISKTNVL
jgi:archaeal flagellin FlaB